MTLSLYIARRFLGSVGRVFLAFLAILLLIDMIEELRRFSDADIGLAGAAHLALLSGPVAMMVGPAGISLTSWRRTSMLG